MNPHLLTITLAAMLLCAGCMEYVPIVKDIAVSDRVMTPSFGYPCACSISTTDGEAYNVASANNCAKLTPKHNVTIQVENQRICELVDVKVRP